MERHLFYISICILLLFKISGAYTQNVKLTGKPDYLAIHKDINRSYFKIGSANDYNPLFNKHTNDEGYTLGLHVDTRVKSGKSSNYFDVKFFSDLYTKYLRDKCYKIGIRDIYPQYFVEISALDFHYQYLSRRYNCFFSIGGGAGINNKEKPLEGLALFMQGGEDGKSGYHGLLNNNPGEDNIPTGEIEPLFYISPSIIKYFSITSMDSIRSKPYIELQTGFRLGTNTIGSNLFFYSKLDCPVFQFYIKQTTLFKLSFLIQNMISFSKDGLLISPEFGTEVRVYIFSIGFTTLANYGNQNISVLKYVDDEIEMRCYLKFNF
jgi:hypothetical protein